MGRWGTQDNNSDNYVGVSSDGINRETGEAVASEFIIQQKGPGGEHVHLGFNEAGDQLFEHRRD